MRLIKKYSNRRLYDFSIKKVVNHKNIIEYILQGEELKIVDNETSEDITAQVLSQTFLKMIMENKNQDFQIFLLSSLIREISNNLPGLLIRFLKSGIGMEILTPERILKIVEDFIDKGNLKIYEKQDYINYIQNEIFQNKNQILNRIKKITKNSEIPFFKNDKNNM